MVMLLLYSEYSYGESWHLLRPLEDIITSGAIEAVVEIT